MCQQLHEYKTKGTIMIHRVLCYIGQHEMVEYVILKYPATGARLIGNRCSRCHKVASGQEGIAELARSWFILCEKNNESK